MHAKIIFMASTLQIRNVSEDLHTAIATHAHEYGMTISQYLLRRIAQIEGKSEIADVLDAHWEQTKGSKRAAPGKPSAFVREDREG
jgi:hypothetical protein